MDLKVYRVIKINLRRARMIIFHQIILIWLVFIFISSFNRHTHSRRLSNMIFRDHKSIDPVMLDRNTADLNMPDGNITINSAASLDFDFCDPNDSILIAES